MRALITPDAAPSRGRGLLGSMLLRRLAVVVAVVAVLVGMGGVSVSLSHGVSFGGVSPAAAAEPAPGETWTARSASGASSWYSVVYGNGVFVAVARTGTNRVMTSPDGVTWTTRTSAIACDECEVRVTFGNGVFVAVASTGTYRVMTSPDGVTWTARTAPLSGWRSVTYGNGVFVAVALSSAPGTSRVMTSVDGVTWTAGSGAEENSWRWVTYGNGLFVAVSEDGTNRVMTSGSLRSAPAAPTSLVATAGDGSASIAFTAGAEGDAAIAKYQYKVGSGAWTDAVGTTSPITITGLTNYQTARIRLRAVSSAGDGVASDPVKVWPRVTGSVLSSLKGQSATRIRASFASLNPVGGTASHYWVYAYAKNTNTVVSSCRSSAVARSCVVKLLTAGTEYDVAVRGFFTLTGSPAVLSTLDSSRQTVRTKN